MKQTKLPYGLSDFKRVKEEDYYYIDKSSFIEKIEKEIREEKRVERRREYETKKNTLWIE